MNFSHFDDTAKDAGCHVDDWPEIEPLNESIRPDKFPMEIIRRLPGADWFTSEIDNRAAFENLPFEAVFTNAIGVVSAVTTGKIIMYTKEQKPLNSNLYQLFIFPQGNGKNVQEDLFETVYEHESLLQNDYRQRKKEAKKNNEDFEETMPQLICISPTPQSLPGIVRENNNRVAIVSTEDDLFPKMNGLYTNGKPLTSALKKYFYGEYDSSNEKSNEYTGNARGLLSICMSTQPVTFENLDNSRILESDGTLSRFLYWYPDKLPAKHNKDRAAFDTKAAEEYKLQIQKLLEYEPSEPLIFQFSPEAFDVFWNYEYYVKSRIDDNHRMAGWLTRAAENAARLSLNLHFIQHCQKLDTDRFVEIPDRISSQTLEAGIEIIKINYTHALRTFGLLGANQIAVKANKILDWIKKKGKAEFTQKDLFDSARWWTGIKVTPDLNEPLDLLVSQGYIRLQDPEPSPGRPSVLYEVNPNYLRKTTQKNNIA